MNNKMLFIKDVQQNAKHKRIMYNIQMLHMKPMEKRIRKNRENVKQDMFNIKLKINA